MTTPYRDKWQSDCGTVTLYLGDCLEILPTLERGSVDAVVTDPPYSSGGQFRGDRMRTTVEKYVQSGVMIHRDNFSGDNLDQRMFMAWCNWWLRASRAVSNEGAVLCSFTDWRQLPAITDAAQLSGWVWRNLGTWWKPGVRMQRGRFSSSAEYVVYATNGPHASDGEGSPQNVIQCSTLSGDDKEHIAEKPRAVVDWMLLATRAGGTVLDPFMGSGTTGEGCVETGRRFIGMELDQRNFELAKRRIVEKLKRSQFLNPPAKKPTQKRLVD